MQRYQDWPSRMTDWLRAHAQDTHAYGSWDCALMAASHIDAIAGTALFSAHAWKYVDAESAADYLIALGVEGLAGLATQTLGAPLKNERTAQRGDIVTFDTQLGPALGIVDLSGIKIVALDPSLKGFVRLPRNLATAAWRV